MSDDEATNVFIQWKGTDVCLDFYCECGAQCHYDGYHAYNVKCPACGEVWSLPSVLPVVRAKDVTRDPSGFDFHGAATGYVDHTEHAVVPDYDGYRWKNDSASPSV